MFRRPITREYSVSLWRPWFAWHPVWVPDREAYSLVWLKMVERREIHRVRITGRGPHIHDTTFAYRFPPKRRP